MSKQRIIRRVLICNHIEQQWMLLLVAIKYKINITVGASEGRNAVRVSLVITLTMAEIIVGAIMVVFLISDDKSGCVE